ncbi:MAG: phosphoribosyltransferase family protein [Chloroflexota bacterium]
MLRQMQYRSLADLNRDVLRLLTQIPRDIDLVVGVPRSGLLAANLFALYLNLPLADVDGFLAGRTLASGRRGGTARDPAAPPTYRSILVVDDSISSGQQLRVVKERIAAAQPAAQVAYVAVYATSVGASQVDFAGEIVEKPRCFEWNVLHHDQLDTFCVDIDGVLCLDPTSDENDDGERYEAFLREAIPYFLPTRKVGWLVTCRLERYRQHTERWLQRHGVQYGQLLMMQYPDAQARKQAGAYAEYKAEAYQRTGAALFIESSERQAVRIAALTGKPVLCLETGTLATPDELAAARRVARELPQALPALLLRRARRGLSRLAAQATARATGQATDPAWPTLARPSATPPAMPSTSQTFNSPMHHGRMAGR